MERKALIEVEVVYASSMQQRLVTLELPEGSTIEAAIYQSGLLAQFPEIDLAVHQVGIFSKVVALNTLLKNGDRVEIYRPLLIDPKQIRRARAYAKATKKRKKL